MSFFEDRIAPIALSTVRGMVLGFCQGAGLKISNWRIIGVGFQTSEAHIATAHSFSQIVATITRGFASLETSTDPGDVDFFDANNEALPPADGFLSNLGLNTHFTTRQKASFGSGFVTFTNNGTGVRVLRPRGLIFTWTGGSPPNPAPTYTNAEDASIYTDNGTVTVAPGVSIVIPVVAQVIGSFASAPSSALSLTTSLVGCTATNANPIVGNDREDANVYKTRCRQAAARLSLGGPAAAYEYLAAKNIDGTVLLNDSTPPVPSGITRVQVTQDSATGIVRAYYASGSGPAIADDISAANRNIKFQAFAVPDAITFTGQAAIATSIHVQGTGKIKARFGVTAQAVAEGMVAALTRNGKVIPIGGVDQVAGAGVVYTNDLEAFARSGYDGLYDVKVTTPAGASTAITVGHVPVLTSVAGDGLGSADWTITVVP